MPFERSVGAVIYRREKGKALFLLIQHPGAKKATQGHWDFPKGHMEKGEELIDTLKREIKEETGIEDLNIISGFNERVSYFYRARGEERMKRKEKGVGCNVFKTVHYFICETKTKKVRLSKEHINYAWLDYEDALQTLSFPSSRRVLSEAFKFLKMRVFIGWLKKSSRKKN